MRDKPAQDQPHRIIEDVAPESSQKIEQDKTANEFSAAKTVNGQLSMDVKVYSPFKSYYDGEAFSISGVNATGPFDILPTHHNFISLLSPCELIVRASKGDSKIQIAGGLMHVKADKITVFLDV